jgi:capsular exopolysaccharide synthesis family protein
VLKGNATLDDVAQETSVKGLWAVTAGPVPPNPSELLSSPRLAEFIHEAAGRFDRILFDSPPVGAVTDACVLAPELDAVVHVIGYGRASRQEVREGKRQLTSLGAKYLGAVFNDVPLNKRWYGKLYGYKYAYSEKYAGYYSK